MIRRETLEAEKRASKKMDYHPTLQTVHMLLDASLELMDAVDGGAAQRNWERERLDLDKQVMLALLDMRAALLADDVKKALYITDCIQEMAGAKLRNRRRWSWYQPRIEEEFVVNGYDQHT